MKRNNVTIQRSDGLQSKSAAGLVQIAGKYQSNIWLEQSNKRINAKSLMGVLSMKLKKGDTLFIVAVGEDEADAFASIQKYLQENA